MSSIFSFLVATDTHLGFEETNHIIGDDSFVTFEEILLKAVDENVDFILLGGDLFHHNNPSQKCMNKCMELLRRYTLGDRPVYFELLSNASEVFSNSISQTTNYLDDNINVSIPVFSIHGNHDDPSGAGHFSALDTLSSAGLINYFGKWTDLEVVTVKPILLRKGKTKIAIFGLSHIKDDRLCRLFLSGRVTFVRPEVDPDSWFNIFVLHQNRVDRGPKRFIAESYIPDYMDLVIWGHEHDCEIEPLKNMAKGFYIIQPGSSIPTSLSEGESIPKHVAVIKVYEKKMKVTPLILNTVRPFVWRTEKLWEVPVSADNRVAKSDIIKTHCAEIVEEMIEHSRNRRTGHPKQPTLPLIRLRCEYTDETQLFNLVKFGQMFQGQVANPNGEIIRLKKAPKATSKEKSQDLAYLKHLYKEDMAEAYDFTACVNHIVQDYFTQHKKAKMLIMKVPEMAGAVERFIDKGDTSAIEELVDKKIEKMLKELKQQKVNGDETNMTELFERMRDEEEKSNLAEEAELTKKLEKVSVASRSRGTTSGPVMKEAVGDNDSADGSSTDDEFFRLEKKKALETKVSESDTDEYDATEVKDTAWKQKEGSSDNSDVDFLEQQDHRRMKESPETGRRARGRGRGSRGGRGRGQTTKGESRPTQRASGSRGGRKTKPPLLMKNSFFYDDD